MLLHLHDSRIALYVLALFICNHAVCTVSFNSGCVQCNLGRDDQLNIHMVAHTHDDVGWTATVQQYYDSIVESILTTSVNAMLKNETYRFTYVEMAFFHMWYTKQSKDLQEKVRDLVQTGRLQIALGGWVSSDEATVFYGDEIDQLTLGHAFIHKTFGKQCKLPRVAWQVDPFGHARDRAQLYLDAGFDSLYFQRMHYVEKQALRKNRGLEFLWNPNSLQQMNNGGSLFTHVFFNTYCYVEGGCFGSNCGFSSESQDIPTEIVNIYLDNIKTWQSSYPANHIMVPIGCDFTFQNAEIDFHLMNSLIAQLHGRQIGNKTLNVFYSTPACYTEAVNRALLKEGKLKQRTGDFFPYASEANKYWTGFYTSRPALKYFVRLNSLILTITEQLNVLSTRNAEGEVLEQLRQQTAIVQHHDAVSGTEQQAVADDYVARLYFAAEPCKKFIGEAIDFLQNEKTFTDIVREFPTFCNQRNISLCSITDTRDLLQPTTFLVTLYNPLGWELPDVWLRVPIHVKPYLDTIQVTDLADQDSCKITHQLVGITHRTKNIPERQLFTSEANRELVFRTAANCPVPALGFRTFQIQITPYSESDTNESEEPRSFDSKSKMSFDLAPTETGVRITGTHVGSKRKINIDVEMLYYMGQTEPPVSGAYVFNPKGKANRFESAEAKVITGPAVNEVHVTYNKWATMVVRRYMDEKLEIEWTVGPIPDNDSTESREVIVRYTVDGDIPELIPTDKGEFFTDSTGRRLIRRIRRDDPSDSIASNYYPIVNRIMIKGARKSFGQNTSSENAEVSPLALAVYTDRAQGGSSLQDGQLELMVHRRLVMDDALGVTEPLMEPGVDGKGLIVRGSHWLVLDELSEVEQSDRYRAMLVTKPPIPLFTKLNEESRIGTVTRSHWTAVRKPLPDNIHLLSLVRWPLIQEKTDGLKQVLLRLENTQSIKPGQQSATTIDIADMFVSMRIRSVKEMILTADELKSVAEEQRLKWINNEQSALARTCLINNEARPTLISLHPEAICTLICDVELHE